MDLGLRSTPVMVYPLANRVRVATPTALSVPPRAKAGLAVSFESSYRSLSSGLCGLGASTL
jgi:hypothetical protein